MASIQYAVHMLSHTQLHVIQFSKAQQTVSK